MQLRQIIDVKTEEAKQRLIQWMGDAHVKLQPMVDQLKLLRLDQWAHIAAIASSSSSAVVSAFEIATRLTGKAGADEALMRRILNERESAVNSYKQANQALMSGSQGLALIHINHAVDEFTKTPLRVSQHEVWADKQLYIEMLVLKGMIHIMQNEPKHAIKALKLVLSIDENALLANNLLASLYLEKTSNADLLKNHLEKSHLLSSQQVFANYYLGKLNGDEGRMRKAMDKLLDAFAESTSKDEPTQAWLNLQATTTPSMVVAMLLDWLDYSTKNVNEPYTLATIANMGDLLNKQPTDIMSKFSVRILEVRLAALNKLAKLKAHSAEFEAIDLDWQKAYGLAEQNPEDHDNYFIEFPVKSMSPSIAMKFDNFNWSLLSMPAQQAAMAAVIAGWAMHGWLPAEPCFDDLRKAVKAIKHLQGAARNQSFNNLIKRCQSPDYINAFINLLIISPIRWENICKVALHNNGMHSVFNLMCSLSNIELLTYEMKENALVYCQAHSSQAEESALLGEARINSKTKRIETIHVAYQPETNSLTLLEPLDTPNRVYSRIALQTAWQLIEKDPSNRLARTYLSGKGILNLPAAEVVAETQEAPLDEHNEASDDFNDVGLHYHVDFPSVSKQGFFSRDTQEAAAGLLMWATAAAVVHKLLN